MDAITCERFEADVGDWLDEELAPEARSAMDAHRASCAGCAALVADLRHVQREARRLAPLTPSRDLWQGIESRIEAPVIPLAESPSTPVGRPAGPPRRTWQVAPRWLAAAATALVVVSSSATYLLTRGGGPAGETGPWVIAGATFDPAAVRPAAAGQDEAPDPQAQYARTDREIAELRDLIASRRGQLDSATVATIERSLRVIDDAIAESRAALARDPGNSFLHEQLDETLQRKLELMRALASAPARS